MGMLRDYISKKYLKPVSKSATDKVHVAELGATPGNRTIFAPDHNKFTALDVANLYIQSPYVYAAVRLIAASLLSVPLNVYTKNRNGAVQKKTTGPIVDLLNFVNKDMTPAQLIEFTVSWYVMYGNVYWAIEDTPEEYASISKLSIYPLSPRYIKIVPDPVTKVDCYVYEVGGKRIYYPANRVIAFNSFSTVDYWVGNAPVNSLGYDIQIERFMKRQLRNKFFNGSTIDSVLTVPEALDDTEIIKMKRDFKEQHTGTSNAGRLLVVTEGMKFDRIPEVTTDSTTSTLMDSVFDSHAMVFGVPNVLLKPGGLAKDIKEAKALFWENTIVPLARVIQETITKKICMPASPNLSVQFDFSNVYALRINDLDRARVEIAHINAGVKTPDEIRIERGLDPLSTEFSETPFPQWLSEQATMQQKIALGAKGNTQTDTSPSGAGQGTPAGGSGASPSLPNGGSEGGRRNQSASGEAQMLDSSGKRGLYTDDSVQKLLESLQLAETFDVSEDE